MSSKTGFVRVRNGYLKIITQALNAQLFCLTVIFIYFFIFVLPEGTCAHQKENAHPTPREGWSHWNPFPPFLHPVRFWGTHSHVPGMFVRLPSLRFEPWSALWYSPSYALCLTTVLWGQPVNC